MRRRRNPIGIDLGTIVILGGILYLAGKLGQGSGPKDSGVTISKIDYFAWLFRNASQDFHVFLNHKGAGGLYKIRVSLTTGTSAIPALFGQHGTDAWENFLYVSLPDDDDWASYDFHITGNMNVDGLKTYNIYTSVANPAGQIVADNWRNGAIYVA